MAKYGDPEYTGLEADGMELRKIKDFVDKTWPIWYLNTHDKPQSISDFVIRILDQFSQIQDIVDDE